ncbi:hypothetical protein Tco_1420501 [Tanacetum coccineum]
MRRGSSKPHVKRKLVHGSLSTCTSRVKTTSSKDNSLFLTISDNDKGKLLLNYRDGNACHLKISAITPSAWKGHLENQLDLELLDLHDRCYVRQEKEKARDQECEELRVKCETTMNEFDKNSTAGYQVSLSTLESKVASLEVKKVRLEVVEASLRQELENAKLDWKEAFEEVANMKEPFDLTKVMGYRPSYKQELTMAGNEFTTATFLYLADVVADPYSSIETLLSKKPRVLQRLVTPAAASVTKPQSPPPTQ